MPVCLSSYFIDKLKRRKRVQGVRPIYWKLLIGALVIFIISVSVMLCDIYERLGDLEHGAVHAGGKCPLKH